MSRICPFCKAPLSDDARFCGSCGESLPPERPAAGTDLPDGCAPFRIQVASPAAFRVGRRSPLEVRFEASEDVFSQVAFRLLCADREVAARELGDRPGTSERIVLLQITPQCPGGAALELQVSLMPDGMSEPEVYVTRFVAEVDEAPSGSPTLTVAPHIVSDHAGHNEIGTLNLNIDRGALGADPINVTRYTTLQAPQRAAVSLLHSPARLTLRAENGQTVQLLSDDEITFGRNHDNLVVSRVYGADGCLNRAANEGNISRFHFKVVHRQGEAYVIDAGSSYGTRLNGAGIDAACGNRLVRNAHASVAAGRPDVELRYDMHAQTGGWTGNTVGLVVERDDGAPETVVAVWSGHVSYEGGAFQHDAGRWAYVNAQGEATDLGLFSHVRIGERVMRVMPFHKPFL